MIDLMYLPMFPYLVSKWQLLKKHFILPTFPGNSVGLYPPEPVKTLWLATMAVLMMAANGANPACDGCNPVGLRVLSDLLALVLNLPLGRLT